MSIDWGDVQTVVTIGLLIAAVYQIRAARSEARRDRTLKMCFAYDSDPVISEAVRLMREIAEGDPCTLDHHTKSTLLNYFDVMAIGIRQKSYNYKIVYAQFKNFLPQVARWLGVDDRPTDFPDLKWLIARMETQYQKEAGAGGA